MQAANQYRIARPEDLSPVDRLSFQRMLIQQYHESALEYTVFALEGTPLILAPHLTPICDALDRVFLPKNDPARITRLLINIPPGYGKTLSAVWAFIARGFVVNPGSRFIHTSYSVDLALDNSTKVRDVLSSEVWSKLGRINLRRDIGAKSLWRTDDEGGLRAAQAGGGITGFRAGRMDTREFSGAMVIDDPLKPDDARSRKKVKDQNGRYNTTIASRLAHEDVPIIVIMQRLCSFNWIAGDEPDSSGDLSEFLLKGGSGEKWHHLLLPAIIDRNERYPFDEWPYGIPLEHDLPDGPLWGEKLSVAETDRLRRANSYVYEAQYRQRPKKRTGDPIIERSWFKRYKEVPDNLRRIEIFVDTANKTKEANDYSVFLVAGANDKEEMFILDINRGKWKIPELLPVATDFWNKWKEKGASRIRVEDKQSGTYLIQSMEITLNKTIVGIQRNVDKFTRVNGVTEPISSGRVYVPESASWVEDFLSECESFTDNDSHEYDDQVDALADAIETLIHNKHTPARTNPVAGFY